MMYNDLMLYFTLFININIIFNFDFFLPGIDIKSYQK